MVATIREYIGNFRVPASLWWVSVRWSKISVDPERTPLWSIPPVINVLPSNMVTIEGYQRPTSIGVSCSYFSVVKLNAYRYLAPLNGV